uniref:Uncharacterized protein n=1 Tax=Ditylenchus dipsaci TaxID=166011 RepID=A0A915CUH7_9BILA
MPSDEQEAEPETVMPVLDAELDESAAQQQTVSQQMWPATDSGGNSGGGLPTSQSKLHSLPREDLVKLVKKQLIGLNHAKNQIEVHKKEAEKKDKKIAQLLTNNPSSGVEESEKIHAADMISMELSDYKRGFETVKQQLKESHNQLAAKQEMLDQLSSRLEALTDEKEHFQEACKHANAEAAKLRASMEEKSTVISENSKEIDSLVVQMSQLKSTMEDEITNLNQTVLRQKQRLVEEQRQDGTKAAEIRRLKAENELLERRLDDLEQEHKQFKERAQYVLKQQSREKEAESNKQNGSVEVQQLIETLASRNENISQLTARCSFLSEEVHIGQEHIQNLQAELEAINHSTLLAQNRDQMERRTLLAGHEQRMRQMHTQLDKLREEKKAIEIKYELDKATITQDFNQRFEQLLSQNQKLSEEIQKVKAASNYNNSNTINNSQSSPGYCTGIIRSRVRFHVPAQTRSQDKVLHHTTAIINRPSKFPLSNQFERQLKDLTCDDSLDGGRNSESESLASDDLQSVLNDTTLGLSEHRDLESAAFGVEHSREEEEMVNVEDIMAQLNHSRELLSDVEENNIRLMEQNLGSGSRITGNILEDPSETNLVGRTLTGRNQTHNAMWWPECGARGVVAGLAFWIPLKELILASRHGGGSRSPV